MLSAALLAALIAVESAGNDSAVGDSGRALGCLQIHACVIEDVNRIAGTEYTHADALDRGIALRLCELYLRHYCGDDASPEQYARTWNGGPRGPRKRATLPYWNRVRQRIGATQ